VSEWQHTLSIADQVIATWFEVQRTWLHLESIFMSSEDIQSQLPDDASRFHRIDEQFKVGSVSVNNRLTVLDTERYDFINLMVLHQHWFWFVYDVRMAMV